MIVTELNSGNILPTFHLATYVTFGRDAARFGQLIEFLTWLSIILWLIVALTMLLRARAHYSHIWYQRKHRKAIAHDVPSALKQSTEKKRHGYS